MTEKSNLICSICLDTLYEPMEHRSCGNIFCQGCLKDIKICPLCREDFTDIALLPVTMKLVLNAISEVHFKCPDCKKKVKRVEEKVHLQECKITCEYCEKPIMKMYKEIHQAGECEANCRQCWKKIRPVCMLEHLSEDCPYRSMNCPASAEGCDWKGMARDLERHKEECKLWKCKEKYEILLEKALGNSSKAVSSSSSKSVYWTFAIRCNLTGRYLNFDMSRQVFIASKDQVSRFYFETVSDEKGERQLNVGEKFRIKMISSRGNLYFERRRMGYGFGLYYTPEDIWIAEYAKPPHAAFLRNRDKVYTGHPLLLKVFNRNNDPQCLTIEPSGHVSSMSHFGENPLMSRSCQMISFVSELPTDEDPVMVQNR